jgi:hypothetical protein
VSLNRLTDHDTFSDHQACHCPWKCGLGSPEIRCDWALRPSGFLMVHPAHFNKYASAFLGVTTFPHILFLSFLVNGRIRTRWNLMGEFPRPVASLAPSSTYLRKPRNGNGDGGCRMPVYTKRSMDSICSILKRGVTE